MYKFYGWERTAEILPAVPEYKSIRNPQHLYDILTEIWCEYTCAPRLREKWSRENRTLGQCSVTAFLVQDLFGGTVYGIRRPAGNFHCYNVVNGIAFDLTSEQFGDEILDYSDNPEQLRDIHFSAEEKYMRYRYLCEQLKKYTEQH